MDDTKGRDDPEFKLDQIQKLLSEYEQRKYLVLPVWRIREIMSGEKYEKVVR